MGERRKCRVPPNALQWSARGWRYIRSYPIIAVASRRASISSGSARARCNKGAAGNGDDDSTRSEIAMADGAILTSGGSGRVGHVVIKTGLGRTEVP